MNYITIPLNSDHNRSDFSCGNEMLDNYIKKQASQDMKRKLAVVFIIADKENNIVGYYTLSNDNIPQTEVPENIRKKMPASYSKLPTTLIGRLAVDKKMQGKNFGKKLLMDALCRSYEVAETVSGSIAVVVDPFDKEATEFYNKYGFIEFPDRKRMFLPMKTIKQLF